MPRKPSLKTYTETVGEISVRWNLLERSLNLIGHHYLGTETDVSGYLFATLGNQSKADFFSFLVNRNEKNPIIAEAAQHFISAFTILRENRNIIVHATPNLDRDKRYLGSISKPGRKVETLPFDAPMGDMKTMLDDLNRFWMYAQMIVTASSTRDDHDSVDALAHVLTLKDKFPLPRKISPLQPPKNQPGD